MKSVKRPVDTSFWEDDKVIDCFTPEDKYFFLYLLTNPHTSQVGIYHLPYRIAAFELGYSLEAAKSLIDRFENKYHVICYSKKHQEIAILNALKHNIIKGGKPVEDCIRSELRQVKDTELIQKVYDHLEKFWEGSHRKVDHSIQQIFSDQLLGRKEPKEVIIENENVNEIENDNENERIVHDSSLTTKKSKIEAILPFKLDDYKLTKISPYLKQLDIKDINNAISQTASANRPSFVYLLATVKGMVEENLARKKIENGSKIPIYKLGE
jgi:hypothetical protein